MGFGAAESMFAFLFGVALGFVATRLFLSLLALDFLVALLGVCRETVCHFPALSDSRSGERLDLKLEKLPLRSGVRLDLKLEN